ncbi:hypothetical protein GLOIN_2v1868524 [Rhizophagus clarus]|uniref:Uncharacterized protein n=1 Tax=Rhizophagus clarus TaxID=94130 RepID=A0A8H3L6M5_9GLOM|nr:hypothetical protein GLOIN_2v1868524 [Rhizophagus clarus]
MSCDLATFCFDIDIPKISRINLTYSVRETTVLSRRADHRTAKGIKAKLLTLFNGVDDKKLKDNTGPWTQLDSLVNDILKSRGFILYYQIANVNQPVKSPDQYYQLTSR